MEYQADAYDIAVIGAGHAGIEAALAAARLGCKTILFTLSIDAVANMPCNPSIGGIAKGHLVREIDALGGEMGKAADATTLQSRMLNRGKGPAVHSLRAQIDRAAYHLYMKSVVEKQERLLLRQAEIVDIRLGDDGKPSAVVTEMGAVHAVRAVIVATGTYLRAKTYVGDVVRESGPDGLHPANRLTECLLRMGFPLRRFKTGTPARVHASSIDFEELDVQYGDEPIIPFSFESKYRPNNRILCHIAYTNEETHRVIRENLDRSPLFGGHIKGTGTRYCPSIEDKVVRFADKDRHQIFVEPMGLDTEETYLQGASSSLPEDVQLQLYRSIKGLARVRLMRTAYAIEYDCVDPLCLSPTMQFLKIPGLFGAGQINGTSGYEEAAAQGLVAGINAAHYVLGREPLVLTRETSYIGTLIDDLTTEGCLDPYRMMTSRSEFRLVLRQDNADARLTPIGYKVGLISESRWEAFQNKMDMIKSELERVKKTNLPPTDTLNDIIVPRGTSCVTTGIGLAELIRRPQLGYDILAPVDTERPKLPGDVTEQVEIQIKYEGYIARQMTQVEKMRTVERQLLPEGLDYYSIHGLRLEAREKLTVIRPRSIGQASRISGVSPADISVLMIYLNSKRGGVNGSTAEGSGEIWNIFE